MYQKKRVLVNVIPWTDGIEEIRSCNVRIDRNLAINIISMDYASFLGCRITAEEPILALVNNEPVKLLGTTNILLRLPKTKRIKGNFTKIKCTVAENPKYNIILARKTQISLKLYPQPVQPTPYTQHS